MMVEKSCFTKYILINYPGDVNRGLFDPHERDNITEPYILLRDVCRKLGYSMEAVGRQSLAECAWLLYFDASSPRFWTGIKGLLRRLRFRFWGRSRDLLGEARHAGFDRLAVFLYEPPVGCPANWDANFYGQFRIVFSWNDELVDGLHIHKFHLPIPVRVPSVEKVNFNSKKLLVNISSDKFSRYHHELYSARRNAIRYFEKMRPNDFDLYGFGWNNPWYAYGIKLRQLNPSALRPYTSYRGPVKHKWEVFPRYKFALCYENSSDQPGFITERIFDCMRADCVPIYWGAPNVTKYVDSEAFIDRRQFKSSQELEEYLCGINERQYNQFREAIAAYLASERFKAFLSPAFVENVIQVLGLDCSK